MQEAKKKQKTCCLGVSDTQPTHNYLVFTVSHILHLPLGCSCSTLPPVLYKKSPQSQTDYGWEQRLLLQHQNFSIIVSAELGQGEGKGECNLSCVLILIQFLKWKAASYDKNLKEYRRCCYTS